MLSRLSQWFAPIVLVAGFGLAAPAPAQAQSADELVRVIVDIADVVYHGGKPYYRHGNYRSNDRLIVVRDRRGRSSYYRHVPRSYRNGPPYGRAVGYYRNGPGSSNVKCNRNGRCKATSTYYDPRHDRDRRDRDRRHARNDRRRW